MYSAPSCSRESQLDMTQLPLLNHQLSKYPHIQTALQSITNLHNQVSRQQISRSWLYFGNTFPIDSLTISISAIFLTFIQEVVSYHARNLLFYNKIDDYLQISSNLTSFFPKFVSNSFGKFLVKCMNPPPDHYTLKPLNFHPIGHGYSNLFAIGIFPVIVILSKFCLDSFNWKPCPFSLYEHGLLLKHLRQLRRFHNDLLQSKHIVLDIESLKDDNLVNPTVIKTIIDSGEILSGRQWKTYHKNTPYALSVIGTIASTCLLCFVAVNFLNYLSKANHSNFESFIQNANPNNCSDDDLHLTYSVSWGYHQLPNAIQFLRDQPESYMSDVEYYIRLLIITIPMVAATVLNIKQSVESKVLSYVRKQTLD